MLVEIGGVQPVLIAKFETKRASNAEAIIDAMLDVNCFLFLSFFGAFVNRYALPMIRGMAACGINILLLIIAKKFIAACPAGMISLSPLEDSEFDDKNKFAARRTKIKFPP